MSEREGEDEGEDETLYPKLPLSGQLASTLPPTTAPAESLLPQTPAPAPRHQRQSVNPALVARKPKPQNRQTTSSENKPTAACLRISEAGKQAGEHQGLVRPLCESVMLDDVWSRGVGGGGLDFASGGGPCLPACVCEQSYAGDVIAARASRRTSLRHS